MRIALGGVIHETNTFCKGLTPASDFRQLAGQEIIEAHSGVRSYQGGVIEAAGRHGYDLVPIFVANATPSATIARDAYESLRDRLLDGIRNDGPFDAICLTLHGAGVAEGYDDIEGDIVRRTREIVGPDVPIVVTLDLHGNMTEEMVRQANLCLPCHYYPHIDMYERGQEAIDSLTRIVAGELNPTSHLTVLPMMIATTTSNLPPVSEINDLCFEKETEPGVLDCAFCHGFAPADIPQVGITVLATTNGNPDRAREVSEEIARAIWNRRDDFPHTLRSAEEAIEAALATEGRPVILNEASDNPGGGGPGDGTHLMRAMLAAGLEDATFGHIWDPDVAAQAHEAGPGATIEIRLGGRTEELHGEPIETSAYVKSVTDGRFIQQSPMGQGARIDLGKMARLEIGGIDVLISSERSQTRDAELFLLHGIDVMRYKIVAIKSSAHFRAGFEPIAHAIIQADTPGLNSVDLSAFTYHRVDRPHWPPESDTEWP
ncbi:M81 family metallopeptidase [soil metagenome]